MTTSFVYFGLQGQRVRQVWFFAHYCKLTVSETPVTLTETNESSWSVLSRLNNLILDWGKTKKLTNEKHKTQLGRKGMQSPLGYAHAFAGSATCLLNWSSKSPLHEHHEGKEEGYFSYYMLLEHKYLFFCISNTANFLLMCDEITYMTLLQTSAKASVTDAVLFLPK